MNKEFAELLISSWNGEDSHFLCDGDLYTEDDVNEAEDYLKNIQQC